MESDTQFLYLTLREFFLYFNKSGEIKQTFNRYVARNREILSGQTS